MSTFVLNPDADKYGVEFRKQKEWFFLPKTTLLSQKWHHQKRKDLEIRYYSFGECIYAHYDKSRSWHTNKFHGGTVIMSSDVVNLLSELWQADSIKAIIDKSLYWPYSTLIASESNHLKEMDMIQNNAYDLFRNQAILPDHAYNAYLYLQHQKTDS
jgi:hypothetical protein